MKILGIELGINAIGWAVVENDNHIAAAGCRVIPMGADAINDFLKGKNPANQRAEYRRKRLQHERQLMRRERLLKELKTHGLLPEHFAQQIDPYGHFINQNEPKLAWNNGKFIFEEAYNEMLAELNGERASHDQTIHYLRKKALTQAISKEALAWIILQCNKHRGRSSERDRNKEELQQILAKQQAYIPELTDDCCHTITDEILYYQRPVRGKAPFNKNNPVVEQLLAEMRRVVKAIAKRHGPIDEIRVSIGIHRDYVGEMALASLRTINTIHVDCFVANAPRNDDGNDVWASLLRQRFKRFTTLTGLKPKINDNPYIDYRHYTLNAITVASADIPDNTKEVLEHMLVSFDEHIFCGYYFILFPYAYIDAAFCCKKQTFSCKTFFRPRHPYPADCEHSFLFCFAVLAV